MLGSNTKKVYALAVVSLFLVYCIGVFAEDALTRDSDLQKKLTGVWIVDMRNSNGDSAKGTVDIASDGSFKTQVTVTRKTHAENIRFEGRWEVKDGFLVETVTKSNGGRANAGDVTRDKIIRVDDEELVYQTEDGFTRTRKRSK